MQDSVPTGPSHACRLVVSGRVQGVGFRYFTRRQAARLGLSGWVRNLPSGDVEVHVEGAQAGIRELIAALSRGPDWARVDAVRESWQSPTGAHRDFHISD